MRVFLAAPFFNPAQVEHLEKIEATLTRLGFSFYSARLENKCPPDADRQTRVEVFQDNLHGIESSQMVLACCDWLLPLGVETRLTEVEVNSDTGSPEIQFRSGPLNIPDSGTVFELGYARAHNVPTIGFWKEKPQGKAVNLMLTETFNGVLYGYEAMEDFFERLRVSNGDLVACLQTVETWTEKIQ